MPAAWLCRKVFQLCDGWASRPRHHVFRHGRLRHLNAEHEQFAVNAGRAPQWVGHAHLSDQVTNLTVDRWPADARARFPAPVGLKAATVPADDGLGLVTATVVEAGERAS